MAKEHFVKVRALIAQLEDDTYPMFVCAMDLTTWEIIPEEDWVEFCQRMKVEALGPHYADYDYRDVTISLPGIDKSLFEPPFFTGRVEEVTEHGRGDDQ